MNPQNQQTPQSQIDPVQQPAVSAQAVTGMKAPSGSYTSRQRKIALFLAILSIVIFFVGIIFGYVWIYTAFLGAYATAVGIRTKSKLIIVLGIVGTILNLGLFLLSILIK